MRRLLLLILFVGLPIASARAQASPALAELQIEFWPEYDRQAMLVIYRGLLSAGTPLPASLAMEFPARYSPPLAVAYRDAQGQLLNLDYTTTIQGDAMRLAFDAPTTEFQFEYYDTSLDLSSPQRRYTFATIAAYPIQMLTLRVQQPAGASGLSAAPELADPVVAGDGLTYFGAARANVAAGDAITLDLTYTKNDSALSIESLRSPIVTPDLPAASAAAGGRAADSWLVGAALVGLGGVALVGGGLAWYLRTRAAAPATAAPSGPRRSPRRKGHPPRPKPAGPSISADRPPAEEAAIFCHECGRPAYGDDRFCRHCGTQLRRD